MVILGLTGSIGMGKTTAADMLRGMGIPVYDSDAAVHGLLSPGGEAVEAIRAAFPDVITPEGGVDRQALGRRVFGDPQALRVLESIIHPRVRRIQDQFLRRAAARREPIVVLDVPLLFETEGDQRCDAVVVVSSPAFLQRQRVLSRPGMTPEKLAGILGQQVPDTEKKRRADFVVSTNLGKHLTLRRLKEIVRLMRSRKGTHWPPGPREKYRMHHARNHS